MLLEQVQIPEGVSGDWRVSHFEVKAEPSIEAMRLAIDGRPIRPGRYTRLSRRGTLVMTDTPAEMRDHYEFVRVARGNVLINGLGLGMCLRPILRKPEVESIIVVEKSADVIKLVAPHYSDPRLTIVEADAYEYQPPKGIRFGAVWHDIWNTICADNLKEMTRLHRKYGRIADWQGSWCREQCRRRR